LARAVLKEYRRVHDEIAATTERREGDEDAENLPIRRSPSDDGKNGTDEERPAVATNKLWLARSNRMLCLLECDFPPDDIRAKSPKEGACHQVSVGDGSRNML
jgi:hypothetical protein